ncbi:hypothetical protein V5O48_011639 [Marasmius crinis-equi]|uniref:Uncharacterized protein n=1 Tax=Marasmius crinis-equi TaxID=585013 RepID=A0ABR3F514_9AGAR
MWRTQTRKIIFPANIRSALIPTTRRLRSKLSSPKEAPYPQAHSIQKSFVHHLPISDTHSRKLSSNSLNECAESDEGTADQSAETVHGFVASDKNEIDGLEELYPSEVLEGMERTEKGLCQRMSQLDKNWKGEGRAYLTCFPNAGDKPAGIKVDEQRGFIINMTDIEGDDSGLVVVDKNDNVLWSQPWPFLKCGRMEYENGYLIFSENDKQKPGYKEIWRLASIPDPAPPEDPSQAHGYPYPTLRQMKLSDKCYNAYKETYPHGHFVPHASLPQYIRNAAFCFHYPTLMLLNSETSVAFYDVPTRELLSTVLLSSHKERSDTDEPLSLPESGRVWSADFSSTHIFLCASKKGSRVYDRETGQCVLDIPADRWAYASKMIRMVDQAGQTPDPEEEDLLKFDFDPASAKPPLPCPYHMVFHGHEEGRSGDPDDEDEDEEICEVDDVGGMVEEVEFGSHPQIPMILMPIPFDFGYIGDLLKNNTDTQPRVPPKVHSDPKLDSIFAAAKETLDVNDVIWKDPGERPHDEAPEKLVVPVVIREDSVMSKPSVPRLVLGSIRVSKCGNHFVGLAQYPEWPRPKRSAHLVVVRDFRKILACDTGLPFKHAVQIDLNSNYAEFAFDRKRRVVVATSGRGTQAAFIVDLGDFLSSSGDIKIRRAVSFDCDDSYEVEITEYGVYLGWEAMRINGWKKWTKPGKKPDFTWGKHICGLDFAVWD